MVGRRTLPAGAEQESALLNGGVGVQGNDSIIGNSNNNSNNNKEKYMDRDGAGIGTRSCLTFRLPHQGSSSSSSHYNNSNSNKYKAASSIRYSDGARKKVSPKTNKHHRGRRRRGGTRNGEVDADDVRSSLLLAQQSTYHHQLHHHQHHQQQQHHYQDEYYSTASAWETFPSVHEHDFVAAVTTTSAAAAAAAASSSGVGDGDGGDDDERHQHQQQQQQQESNPAATTRTNSLLPSLLVPPTPIDRSPQTVLAQKKQQQKQQSQQQQQPQRSRGLYEGEMEPEGVRGQEAAVVAAMTTTMTPTTTTASAGAGVPVMRTSFGNLPSNNRNTIQIVSPVSISSNGSSGNNNNNGSISLVVESRVPGTSHNPEQRQQQQQQQQQPPPNDVGMYGYRSTSRAAHSITKRPPTPPITTTTTTTSRKAILAAAANKNINRKHNNATTHRVVANTFVEYDGNDGGDVSDVDDIPVDSGNYNRNHNHNHNKNNPALDHSDTESTASDDDIRHMLPDLLPPSSDHEYQPPTTKNLSQTKKHLQRLAILNNTQHQQQQPSSPQTQFALSNSRVVSPEDSSSAPSVAAQRAAAAAAAAMVVHEQHQQQHEQQQQQQVSHGNSGKDEPPNASKQQKQRQQQQQQQYDQELDKLNQAAMEHVQKGQYDDALAAFGQVLRMHRMLHGEQHPSTASAHHNLGTVHAKRASVLPADSLEQRTARALALECFQAAARSARDSLGPNHPNVAVSLVRIGFLLLQSKQYKNAIVTFLEALRIRKAHFGENHELVANLHNNLGVCYMHLNDFEHGKGQLEQALQVQRYVVAQADPNDSDDTWVHQLELADTLFNIGGLCLEWIRRQGPDSRRADDAEDAFAEALEIRSSVLGPDDPSVHRVQLLLETARAIPRPPGSRSDRRTPSSELEQNKASSRDFPPHHPANKGPSGSDDIFRSYPSETAPQSQKQPPLVEVSVSHDEDQRGESTEGARIYISPHVIPETFKRNMNVSEEALSGNPLEDTINPDSSAEEGIIQRSSKSMSYDTEENCILADTGVDSKHGRVHFPLGWDQEGKITTSRHSPSIMVAQTMVSQPLQSRSMSSDQWGSETVNFSTGNKDRDDLMRRARMLLNAHAAPDEQPQIPRVHSDISPAVNGSSSEDDNHGKSKAFEQDLLEDGIAPLGGSWPQSQERLSLRTMLHDPMNNLPDIHNEASKQLKDNNAVDAQYLFELVLECQRRRHGPLHPDVASALHNVGIVHLRSQNHEEALKTFEEAARVRKGSLGKDHPLVAVSLVKVGIALLLLHRFDDALWSFREALSVRKHSLGPLHPSTARIYNNIGCVHVEFNEFKEARRAFEAALDVQRNALCHEPDSGPLMFGTATTLCNLGYLYRYRDMHGKAALVLKQAVDLQESVLGRSHATVLSTLDNLADSYANSGQAVEALRTYSMILDRFRVANRSDNVRMLHAEAVLLFKMSRVHQQQNDREAQLDSLKLALRSIRAYDKAQGNQHPDSLERRIQYDIKACREQMETSDLKWV